MPTPQGLKTVTLHGLFVEPDLLGTPLVGQLTFSPNVPMVMFPNENTLMAGAEAVTLDANGEFFIDLVTTYTPGQNPDGWAYTVTEKLVGPAQRTYSILLPYTVAVVELSDIMPPPGNPPVYLPVVGPQGPPGQVTSVNGYTIPNIVLNSDDVGAVSLILDQVVDGVKTFLDSPLIPEPTTLEAAATKGYVDTADALSVKLSGDQSVDGIKTFSSSPVVPTPTIAGQAAPKSYVDTVGNTSVKLTGDQTVAGVKTFSSSPIVPAPTTGTQVAHKTYVDTSIGTAVLLTGNQTVAGVKTFSGNVVMSAIATALKSRITSTTDLTLTSTDHGFQIGLDTGSNLRMDIDEIQSVNNGLISPLYVQPEGGALGIFNNRAANSLTDTMTVKGGMTANQLILAQIAGATLASTTHPLQLGDNTGLNLRMDADEIMAVNNGAASGLNINRNGGSVTIGGNLSVGDMTNTLDVRARLSASNYRLLMDWTDLGLLGTYQTGFSAGTPAPKMRKIMDASEEVWEFEGRIAVVSGTLVPSSTIVAFVFNAGHRVAAERGFQLYGSGTSYYGIRTGILPSGNMTVGLPSAATNSSTGIYLDSIRITSPAYS